MGGPDRLDHGRAPPDLQLPAHAARGRGASPQSERGREAAGDPPGRGDPARFHGGRRGGRVVAGSPPGPFEERVAGRDPRNGHADEPPAGRDDPPRRADELPRRPAVSRPRPRLRQDAAPLLRDADAHRVARLPLPLHLLLQRALQPDVQGEGEDDQPLLGRPPSRRAFRPRPPLADAVRQVQRRHLRLPRGRLARRVRGEVPEGRRPAVSLPDAVRPRPEEPGDRRRPEEGRPPFDLHVDRVGERLHPQARDEARHVGGGHPLRLRLLPEAAASTPSRTRSSPSRRHSSLRSTTRTSAEGVGARDAPRGALPDSGRGASRRRSPERARSRRGSGRR